MTATFEHTTLVKLTILGEITKKTYLLFEEALDKMQEQGQDRLPIILNSIGGFEDIAIMIATRMLAEPEKFVTYAPVQACSAASYIFLAAGERILGEMGHLLFHQTHLTDATMSITKLQENLEECQTRDAAMAKELSAHIGLPLAKYQKLVHFGKDEDTRIWKDVALEHGFCTSVGTAVFNLNVNGDLTTKIALAREQILERNAEEQPVDVLVEDPKEEPATVKAPVQVNPVPLQTNLAQPLSSSVSTLASGPALKKARTVKAAATNTATTSNPVRSFTAAKKP